MATVETTLIASQATVMIDGATSVNAEVYNGGIPGPTIELDVGDTCIVRLINDLPHPTGIHWHGIELQNSADGTPVTQAGVPGAPLQVLGNGVPAGGTYLYKFKAPRPGIYWYHPHHYHSTNRVFRGLYGMIVVTDPAAEAPLVSAGTIPGPTETQRLVLSDVTVCGAVGANDAATYVDPTTLPAADRPEWLSGASAQIGPTPVELCETLPMDEEGNAGAAFGLGDVPNVQINSPGRSVEGQTILTNGLNVGGRLGTPANPGALAAGATTITVQPGQGLRLQIVNCAILRYFRLHLSLDDGTPVPLVRIGGEGGLLNAAILEGGVVGGFDTKYDSGEIVLPPSTRADVVAAIPSGATGVLTLWTRDFQRTGPVNPNNWAMLPTVPVLHLNIAGAPVAPAFAIGAGTGLLSAVGAPLLPLGAATGTLLDPSAFPSGAKTGSPGDTISLTAGGGVGIDGVPGNFSGVAPYTSTPHFTSSRWARDGDTLQLDIVNATSAHHPFHLHGFSFQPISLTPNGGGTSFTFPVEFRDSQDIPSQHTLRLRVHVSDRELADGTTLGGALGRWLLHCHIFFHAHQGMIGELVITDADGQGGERPYVDVRGSWAYAPAGDFATRTGTYAHPDGDTITLSADLGTVNDLGGGEWEWSLDTTGMPNTTTYVHVTAEDTAGRKDQAPFRLKVGAPDDGSDNGDPHIHTVDGRRYDFQAVGEFVLLRDRDGMEVQTRQRPVLTANPLKDPYSDLKACVSLNVAVAARVGSHRVAFQPGSRDGEMVLNVDGKRTPLTNETAIDLDGHLVSGIASGGGTGLRVDYAHHPVLVATPHFWNSHGLWYLNISISRTHADEGLMGPIPRGSWLPRLPSGATLGAMPKQLEDRYQDLYVTFADAWRVTDRTSLFFYAPGTNTDTFTDRAWPAREPPCVIRPGFEIPDAPELPGMALELAQQACQIVAGTAVHEDCVFDVGTTGVEAFAKDYRDAVDARRRATVVRVSRNGDRLTAIVSGLNADGDPPKGNVQFRVDGRAVGAPVPIGQSGRATMELGDLALGPHQIDAIFAADGEQDYDNGRSPAIVVKVKESSPPVAPDDDAPFLGRFCWLMLVVLIIVVLLWCGLR